MTTEEKMEIMQAYVDGKQIQTRSNLIKNSLFKSDWADVSIEPSWDWVLNDYRIKPEEPTYRPYKDADEMIADYKERFKVDVPQYAMPLIWVKDKSNGDIKFIEGYTTILVYVFSGWWSLKVLYEGFTYLDGSPVGKLVEE